MTTGLLAMNDKYLKNTSNTSDSTPEPDYDDSNPPASRQQRSFSACLETLRFQMSDGVPDYNKSAVTR